MSMLNTLFLKARHLKTRFDQINETAQKVNDIQLAIGRIEMRLADAEKVSGRTLRDYEFKVFSQWGEDGIIQYLIHRIPIANKIFVEFGVQDYRESNTRFLLQNDNWSGLVMDSSPENIERIKADPLYFRHDLRAVCAFIDRENINSLLTSQAINGDIGILSIDIDGNDYWVWEAIDCISPRIVICEYENLFGCRRSVVTPYDRSFDRLKAHYSFLYGGASITALHRLGMEKGYSLIGSNSAGNNGFFVRNDCVGSLPVVLPAEAFVPAKYRHAHTPDGSLSSLSREESLQLIADLPLYDVEQHCQLTVRESNG